MKRLVLATATILMCLPLPVAFAQSMYRAAEPCDCTASCPPATNAGIRLPTKPGDIQLGGGLGAVPKYSLPDFLALESLAQLQASGELGRLEEGSLDARLIEQFAEKYAGPGLEIPPERWDGIAVDLNLAMNPVIFLYNLSLPSPEQIIEPAIGKSDLDARWVRLLPDDRKLACSRAVIEDKTPERQSCSAAIADLCKDGCGSEDMLRRLASTQQDVLSATVASLAAYSKACMSTGRPSTDLSMGEAKEMEIFARTGLLSIAPQVSASTGSLAQSPAAIEQHRTCDAFVEENAVRGAFCTAVAIDEQTLLTARHCFFQSGTETAWNGAKSCLDVGRLKFLRPGFPLGAAPVKLMIDERKVQNAGSKLLLDHVRLTLFAPLEGVEGKVARAAPLSFDKVLVPGFNPLFLYGASDPPGLSWSKGGCRVIAANENCALSRCQTFGGTSGAPVWRTGEGASRPELVGLHVRDAEETALACRFPAGSAFPKGLNVALTAKVTD